jgi:NADH-quinone oxidoreductase subunit J
MASLLFVLLALLLIAAALGVVLNRNPVRSAMSLVAALFLLAVIFAMLDAHLVAALQIVVYAGAIMVLFLFVIMLLNLQREVPSEVGGPTRTLGIVGGFLFVAVLGAALLAAGPVLPGAGSTSNPPSAFGTTEQVADSLFTTYVLPFEITSILLLVAIIGAVVMARKRID